MQKKGLELELRDLTKERLTADELERLIDDRDYRMFLNPRHELYRKMNMAEKPPARLEAIRLMAREPGLIRRPVVIRGQKLVLGYDEVALKKLAS